MKQSEQKKWKDSSLDFMSEKSSGEDPEEILVHHLPWRSCCEFTESLIFIGHSFSFIKALPKLINKLDDRAQADSMRTKKYIAKRKTRSAGTPSSIAPPINAAKWTIAQSWQQGLRWV